MAPACRCNEFALRPFEYKYIQDNLKVTNVVVWTVLTPSVWIDIPALAQYVQRQYADGDMVEVVYKSTNCKRKKKVLHRDETRGRKKDTAISVHNKSFRHCVNIIVYHRNAKFNCKVFSNGKIHCPAGTSQVKYIHYVFRLIANMVEQCTHIGTPIGIGPLFTHVPMSIWSEQKQKLTCVPFTTVMINAIAKISKAIVLNRFHQFINTHCTDRVQSVFTPRSYPGLNIHYFVGDGKFASIFIFHTGSVIITGSTSIAIVESAFQWVIDTFERAERESEQAIFVDRT